MSPHRRLRVLGWLRAGPRGVRRAAGTCAPRRVGVVRSLIDTLRITDFDSVAWSALTEEDLIGVVPAGRGPARITCLGSREDVAADLEHFGILSHLRRGGFEDPRLTVEYDHPLGQTLRVFANETTDAPLMEIRLDRSERLLPGMDILVLEWILLQNPSRRFSPARPLLPGQQHPGLGVFRPTFEWLLALCKSLGVDGLYLRPSHYHVGAKVREFGRFLRPEAEAAFREAEATLESLSLCQASWAFSRGWIVDTASGVAVDWDPAPMVAPTSPRMRDLVTGKRYERRVAEAMTGRALTLVPQNVGCRDTSEFCPL